MTPRNRIRRTKIRREAEGYLELGMPRQALDALSRLGNSGGFDAHTLYLWGEALRAMRRFDEALTPLLQAAEVAPENVHVWFALGWCYKRIGRIELAIDSLERAIAVEPDEAMVYYNLACYWSLAGGTRRAVEYLAQALDIDPNYRRLVDEESDFDPVRSDPGFQTLCKGSGAWGKSV